MGAIEHVSRFFGYGSDMTAQNTSTLGDGVGMSGMGAIDGEFKGQLARFRNCSFASTNPEQAIIEEGEAQRLQSSANVYSAMLRSRQLAAGAYVKAATAKLNHDVAMNRLNGQLVAAQGRAVKSHAEIGFKNSMAVSGSQGAVQGYTQQTSTFSF